MRSGVQVITAEREAEFRRDWNEGVLTREALAEKYRCSLGCITSTTRRLRLPKRKHGPKCKDPDLLGPTALTGGAWRLDPRRRIQVWQPA